MYVPPIPIEPPNDFTRVTLKRQVRISRLLGKIESSLFIDLTRRWIYEDCRDWVNKYYPGWWYIRAEHYVHESKTLWVKVPGIVWPKRMGL